MPSCNSPRPATSKESRSLFSVIFSATLPSRLAHQPLADDAALHLVAFLAGERAVIDAEGHGERRRIDRLCVDRLADLGGGDRVGDGRLGQPGNRDDVAGDALLDRLALEAAEGEHLGDAALLDQLAVARQGLDGLVRPDRARR